MMGEKNKQRDNLIGDKIVRRKNASDNWLCLPAAFAEHPKKFESIRIAHVKVHPNMDKFLMKCALDLNVVGGCAINYAL